jgi:hypothetical protein
MSTDTFTSKDHELIRKKGISPEEIKVQLENFNKGFPPITLIAPATDGDGIIQLSEKEVTAYAKKYQKKLPDLRVIKFVPASGAASRMFKDLFEYMNKAEGNTGEVAIDPLIKEFVEGLDKLALKDDLKDELKKAGKDLGGMIAGGEFREIIRTVLQGDGLNYGQLPKALIKFHKYAWECRTGMEEHMVEGAEYCFGKGEHVNLHFTVSGEHLDDFNDLLNRKQAEYENRLGLRYNPEFSVQRSFTDVIAVDPQNHPFREADGSILFRPGGHGALLANLNEMDADLIFIKNVDNICPDRMKQTTYLYKRTIAGKLLEIQDRAYQYILQLDTMNYSNLDKIEAFLEKELGTVLSKFDKELKAEEKADLLKRKLNRPMRVCGMVKNEGEPGGGPFWCRNRDGSVSLQIVESAQINFKDEEQFQIAGSATHFNPVDLVCGTRDYQGKSFDLYQYTDPDTGLISGKTQDGRNLKAQELPGLWNGSMSDWNTVFVEVPIETFTPVKTINDLLRSEHLA